MNRNDKNGFECEYGWGTRRFVLIVYLLTLLVMLLVAICHGQEIQNSEAVEIRLTFSEDGGCCVTLNEVDVAYIPQEKLPENFSRKKVRESYDGKTIIVFNKGPWGLFSEDPLIQSLLYVLNSD